MIENLNLYGIHSFDDQCQRLTAHVGALLNGTPPEYDRARGIVESLVWLNRSAYDSIMRVYGQRIKTVMTSEPAPVAPITSPN